ncbi:MAG: hypothetical protein M3Y58_02240 [Chloroflexota bacterium]|nr:hypothetical protein [Chloroflexota bacterium]
MNFDQVQHIADAVLYEGYLLYPYRQTSVKNQQRWTFGGVYPAAYSAAQRGADGCAMQTECLITGGDDATVTVRVRFLHLIALTVGETTSSPAFRLVDELQVGDRLFRPWQEAVERSVDATDLHLADLIATPARVPIHFPASQEIEPLRDAASNDIGALIRAHQAIDGVIAISAERVAAGASKLSVRIENLTPLVTPGTPSRDDAIPQTFISTHTILGVQGGTFVSLIDPPADAQEMVAGCQNIGTWPVLVGEEGDRTMLLSSPIILYDYPQIAPESAANLFDGTEIDEILTLRILTLTDDEKREIQQSDTRGRDLLALTEAIPQEHFMKMHGVIRSLRQLSGDET